MIVESKKVEESERVAEIEGVGECVVGESEIEEENGRK